MNLSAAHDYVRRGWGVVPLYGLDDSGDCRCGRGSICPVKTRAKHPSNGRAWQDNALSSGPDVQAWFEDHPHDNVGIVTGRTSGLWVLDIDGEDGIRTITALAAEHATLPLTRIVRTGSGGLHYYWRHPPDFEVRNSSSWIGPGVDVRGRGGQVVAPPSVSARGAYELIADHPVADAPAWLCDLVREHASYADAGASAEVRGAERVDIEFVPQRITELIGTLIGEDEGRYLHFYAIVAAVFEADYTQGQAVTLVAPWCAAVGKFVGRVEAEVARAWGKLELEAARRDAWVADAGGHPPAVDVPVAEAGEVEADAELPEVEPTWRPVDLEPILSGEYQPETPELLVRTDGNALIYPGRVHSLHGESESGKSLVAQAESARLVVAGQDVLYIDFESDAGPLVDRMLQLGCKSDQIRSHLTYIRPDTDPKMHAHERAELAAVMAKTYALVVIDGVTDALGVFGASSKDNDEISAFMRTFPRMVARRTRAAVVLVDHVTKDTDTRGRYAVGGQAKMNALDGAAYMVEVAEPLGRGLAGAVVLRVAKDRPGGVRPHCGAFRKVDRTQEAARVVVDSTAEPGQRIEVTVQAPDHAGQPSGGAHELRPTTLMERISTFLGQAAEGVALSQKTIEDGVSGRATAKRQALAILISEGHVTVTSGARGARLHTLARPYAAAADPRSDNYTWWSETEGGSGGDSAPARPGRPTSSHVVPDAGQATSSVPPPPRRGRDEVSGQADKVKNGPARPAQNPSESAPCERCGRDVGPATAKATGGLCVACFASDDAGGAT